MGDDDAIAIYKNLRPIEYLGILAHSPIYYFALLSSTTLNFKQWLHGGTSCQENVVFDLKIVQSTIKESFDILSRAL